MMQSKKWEMRMGGANAAIRLIQSSQGTTQTKLKEKLACEQILLGLSRDEEYRVRQLAG